MISTKHFSHNGSGHFGITAVTVLKLKTEFVTKERKVVKRGRVKESKKQSKLDVQRER